MAVTTLFGAMFPTKIIYLNFIIPVPAILLAAGYVGYDLYQSLANPHDRVSHAGHLGGKEFFPNGNFIFSPKGRFLAYYTFFT
jgi:membrane associated rhomboid family serine protease